MIFKGGRARPAGNIGRPFLVFCGLLLMGIVWLVPWLMPDRALFRRSEPLLWHQAAKNIMVAQRLITPALPGSLLVWTPGVKCLNAQNGVWRARGAVQIMASDGKKTELPWEILFVPGEAESLWLKLNGRESGDHEAALRRAGKLPEFP